MFRPSWDFSKRIEFGKDGLFEPRSMEVTTRQGGGTICLAFEIRLFCF